MSKEREATTVTARPSLDALDALVSQGNDNARSAPKAAVVETQASEPEEPTKIMTTRLPLSVHRRLRRHLLDSGESGQAFALRAVRALLDAEERDD